MSKTPAQLGLLDEGTTVAIAFAWVVGAEDNPIPGRIVRVDLEDMDTPYLVRYYSTVDDDLRTIWCGREDIVSPEHPDPVKSTPALQVGQGVRIMGSPIGMDYYRETTGKIGTVLYVIADSVCVDVGDDDPWWYRAEDLDAHPEPIVGDFPAGTRVRLRAEYVEEGLTPTPGTVLDKGPGYFPQLVHVLHDGDHVSQGWLPFRLERIEEPEDTAVRDRELVIDYSMTPSAIEVALADFLDAIAYDALVTEVLRTIINVDGPEDLVRLIMRANPDRAHEVVGLLAGHVTRRALYGSF